MSMTCHVIKDNLNGPNKTFWIENVLIGFSDVAPRVDDKFELDKNILWKSGKIHKRVSAAAVFTQYPSLLLLRP